MTENLPNLKKEAKKMNQETYTKTYDNTNGKIRKDSNPPSLPLGREKQRVNYKGFPHKAIS